MQVFGLIEKTTSTQVLLFLSIYLDTIWRCDTFFNGNSFLDFLLSVQLEPRLDSSNAGGAKVVVPIRPIALLSSSVDICDTSLLLV